jgi:hypothetical protein
MLLYRLFNLPDARQSFWKCNKVAFVELHLFTVVSLDHCLIGNDDLTGFFIWLGVDVQPFYCIKFFFSKMIAD